MIKIKTLRSAKKRFKKTSTGQFKYKHACMRHILTKKSTKHKRRLRQKITLSRIYSTKIIKQLPYI